MYPSQTRQSLVCDDLSLNGQQQNEHGLRNFFLLIRDCQTLLDSIESSNKECHNQSCCL